MRQFILRNAVPVITEADRDKITVFLQGDIDILTLPVICRIVKQIS